MSKLNEQNPWDGVATWVARGFEGVGQMVEQIAARGTYAAGANRRRILTVLDRVRASIVQSEAAELPEPD